VSGLSPEGSRFFNNLIFKSLWYFWLRNEQCFSDVAKVSLDVALFDQHFNAL